MNNFNNLRVIGLGSMIAGALEIGRSIAYSKGAWVGGHVCRCGGSLFHRVPRCFPALADYAPQ
jgi:hypothetical protein